MPTSSDTTDLCQLEPITLPPLPEEPLVSILMCNYNYAPYIGEAIESVIGQTWPKWELIICDDGSTDSSRAVIAYYASRDERIHVVEKVNGGQASAFNAAFEVCTGDIVGLLDSDDRFVDKKLESVIASFRENPSCGVAIHPLRIIDSAGKPTGLFSSFSLNQGWIAQQIIETRESGLTPSSGQSFRKEVVSPVMPIPANLRICADGYLATTTALLSPLVATQAPLADYRCHGNNSYYSPWPKAPNYAKITEWQARNISGLRDFAQRRFGANIAIQIDVDNHSAYNAALIKYYLLTGKWPSHASGKSLSERMSKLRGTPISTTLWRTLVTLPRFIAVPIFLLWQGQYSSKRFMPRWIRRFFHPPVLRGEE